MVTPQRLLFKAAPSSIWPRLAPSLALLHRFFVESSALAGSEGSGIVCSTWHAVALAPGVTDFIVDFGKVWPGPTP